MKGNTKLLIYFRPITGSYPNGSSGFNIAAAIDPTYQRRHGGDVTYNEETQLKSPFSRSLPQAGDDYFIFDIFVVWCIYLHVLKMYEIILYM